MALINRPPVSIGRKQRGLRDDRFFVIACDDTHAPEDYFRHLELKRVRVLVLPTPKGSGLSAPQHVLERLRAAFLDFKGMKDVQDDDEFWLLFDFDHHFKASHIQSTIEAIKHAGHLKFEVAVSNPCFEVWLLLHHDNVAPGQILSGATAVEARIRDKIHAYNKCAIARDQFPLELIPAAMERARALDLEPDSPWPKTTGTKIYRLFERILPQAGER